MTDNQILINAALKNYSKFKVPVNHVDSTKKKRRYTSKEKADLDIRTSENKIGEIINLSQELNTLLWHKLNSGCNFEEIEELYCDICLLDVLSGIEIDKAKKEFIVNTYEEMCNLKEKYLFEQDEKRKKPYFFRFLQKDKKYNTQRKNIYKKYLTSMDHLETCINKYQYSKSGKPRVKEFKSLSSIINLENYNVKNVYYEQINKVVSIVNDFSKRQKEIFADVTFSSEERFYLMKKLKSDYVQSIGDMKFNESTMIYLLLLCESEEYRKIARNIFKILFSHPNQSFFKVINNSTEPIEVLEHSGDGQLKIFEMNFKKNLVQTPLHRVKKLQKIEKNSEKKF